MDAHSVLVAARNLLNRKGWVQEKLVVYEGEGRPGGFCALGALNFAGHGTPFHREMEPWFAAALRELDEEARLEGGVVNFNNRPGRTKQEVLDLFDRAIASTAPAPPFGSLGQEPATAREPVTGVFA